MPVPESKRRLKVVYVHPEDVIDMLNHGTRRRDTISLPILPAVPRTAVVESVAWDHVRRMFALLIQDPSFEPVPAGGEAPEIVSTIEEGEQLYRRLR